MMVSLVKGHELDRDQMLAQLVDIQYERNDISFERGKFRVRGDVIEIWPPMKSMGTGLNYGAMRLSN